MNVIELEIMNQFPYSVDVGYFNTSVLEYENQLIYFSRKGVWNPKIGFFVSSVSCLKDDVLMDLSDLEKSHNEQIEDPRAFVFDNNIHLGCAVFNYDVVIQRIYRLNKDLSFNSVIEHKIPHLQKWEKNWTYFVDGNNRLLCLYSPDPFCVVDVFTGEIVKRYDTRWNWKWGKPRGGTNPILIDDVYYTFFHSNTIQNNTRIYYMGFVGFDSITFNLVRFSKTPMCRGDKNIGTIKNYPHDNHVIFPMGAFYKENKFIISCGINDYKTGILKFNKNFLDYYD